MGESSRPREPGFRGLKTSSIDKATLVRDALAQTKWRNRGRPRLTETFFFKRKKKKRGEHIRTTSCTKFSTAVSTYHHNIAFLLHLSILFCSLSWTAIQIIMFFKVVCQQPILASKLYSSTITFSWSLEDEVTPSAQFSSFSTSG